MDNNIDPIIVTVAYPTVKEQLVQAGIALAISGAVAITSYVVFVGAVKVGDKITARRRAKKETPIFEN